jgi:transposase
VRQVVEKCHFVPDIAKRLGISDKSLYYWVSKAKVPADKSAEQAEERNILMEVAVYFASESKKSTRS